MVLKAKTILGAAMAISLSTFALPVLACELNTQAKSAGAMQVAQAEVHPDMTDKAADKAHEVNGEASGAAHAVRSVHRQHEANEVHHSTMSGKVDSKIDEAHDEAEAAKNSIKAKHRQHEALEHAEGRD
jgi:hypothetical protein